MKIVLLAGGLGTRILEESAFKPKPMIEIGGYPILWHIMKEFSFYGFNEFVICAGYKQELIKSWFSSYFQNRSDVTFDFRSGDPSISYAHSSVEPWKVTVVDTGYSTPTGGRIRKIREYVEEEPFFMTYGDGLCDVDIAQLLKFHKSHGKIATLTSVTLAQDKGILDINADNTVRSFREKRANDGATINAGYMVLNPGIFDYIPSVDTVFEAEPLERLAAERQLMSYQHKGFWQCMDNIREKSVLESMWANGDAPWKKWTD